MKITLIAPRPNLSGGIRVIAIHARNLKTRGHQVCIAHPRHGRGGSGLRRIWPAKWLAPAAPSHFDDLDVERLAFDEHQSGWEDQLPNADVVIGTWWETAEWVARLPRSKGAKAYFVQGHEVFDFLPKERVRATYRLPLHIITISDYLKQVLRDEYGVVDVSLAPNGVDSSYFHSARRVKRPVPTVGMVYSSLAIKGSDISLRAAELAKARIPELRLVAFGQEQRRAAVFPRWAEYVVAPAQSTIRDIYASCDAWLFGSRSEGYGLPILESMACGTPVIGTPAGAAPQLLAEGGGLLVPHEDPQAMAQAIIDLCTNPVGWQKLSEAAISTAKKYSWSRATDLFEAGLERSLEKDLARHDGKRAAICA